jgi:hypothetical protein
MAEAMPEPKEPRWRTTLCWGSVILYLTIPPIILMIRLLSDHFPDFHWAESLSQAKFMIPYFTSLTALVFGLAGLNTFDRKMGNGPPKSEEKPKKDAKPEEKSKKEPAPEPAFTPPSGGPRATE